MRRPDADLHAVCDGHCTPDCAPLTRGRVRLPGNIREHSGNIGLAHRRLLIRRAGVRLLRRSMVGAGVGRGKGRVSVGRGVASDTPLLTIYGRVANNPSTTHYSLAREDAMATVARRQDSRQRFLDELRSPGKMPYRRYLASPLRYAGGKSLGVGYVIERLPEGLRRLVSPFLGGGSVEIACANELGLEVVAYDVFDILCTYWQVQIAEPQELAKRMREFTPDRDTFAEVKARLKKHWYGERRLERYDLAAHYYFNSNTSYGPHFLGWPSDVYLNPPRYQAMVEKSAGFRAPSLSVECATFQESLLRHTNDFLYCDPPYYLEEGKTFYRNVSA